MKILHTSDWHLGARTGGIDRTDDLFGRIDELADVIDDRQIDCLLIAGDVFDEARSDRLPNLFGRLGRILGPRIADGLSVVAIAGNHDREQVFPLLRSASELLAPEGGAGRVTFTERPDLVSVVSRDGSEAIEVACVPYPTPVRYQLNAGTWASRDDKHAELATAVRHQIGSLAERAERDNPGVPTLLTGHMLIRGTEARLYCMTADDDIPIDGHDLPGFTYIALGHIHAAQALGTEAIRYCGSIDRMDRGEANDIKGAIVITVTGDRLTSTETIALDACPFAAIEAATVDDLVLAHEAMDDPERTMVSLTVDAEPGALGALISRARALFPRLYGDVARRRPPPEVVGASAIGFDPTDVGNTLRGWLERNLVDDEDSHAITALAEELLADVVTMASDKGGEG